MGTNSLEYQRAYMKKWTKTPAGRQARARDHKAHAKRKSDLAKSIKMAHGCSRCGYNKSAAALHFHHRDRAAKRFPIWRGVKCSGTAKFIQELEKCDVLCANCHAEFHDEEGLS